MAVNLQTHSVDLDHPMVRASEPHKPGWIYDCHRCGFVEVVPHPGFVPGHDVCSECLNQGAVVRLSYLGSYYPPTLVWEGDYA